MARRTFRSCKVSGVAAAVPDGIRQNSDFDGDPIEIARTASLCGITTRYVAPAGVCASDLCYVAAETVLQSVGWNKSSVDGIIFLSQSPTVGLTNQLRRLRYNGRVFRLRIRSNGRVWYDS
jgi:3-oxoacyl-[acyl-carrier-protein] synthase III